MKQFTKAIALLLSLALLLCYGFFRILPIEDNKRGVAVTASVFANTAFIGYPLITSLYGMENMLLAAGFGIGYTLFMYTIGVRLFSAEKEPIRLKTFLSSNVVSVIVSNIIYFSPYRLPSDIYTVLGMLAGFIGVGMLYMEQLSLETGSAVHSEYGILILIGGCISWALGTLYAKYRSSGAEEVNAFAGSAWQMLSASALFWICSLAIGECSEMEVRSVGSEAWLSLLYLILFGSLLAYSAYVWLLKVRPATEVATHAYVNPVVAVILGVYIGHEKVSALQLAGLAVIISSVILVEWRTRQNTADYEQK